MSGNRFRRVRAGERLQIPASTYNAMVAAAQAHRSDMGDAAPPMGPVTRRSGIVLVRNDSGSDCPRYGVLGIDGPVIDPDDNEREFLSRVALSGSTPATGDHEARFAIPLEPVANGKIGLACVAGVTEAKVNILSVDHAYADIANGESDYIQSAPTGGAQILWTATSGTGEQWAIIRIGAPGGQIVYALDDCAGEAPTRYTGNDLSSLVGGVVLVGDICYQVREPEPGEATCNSPPCVEILAAYDDCERCSGCWLLEDCDGVESGIVTSTDLAAHEGRVVRLDDGVCYEVSLADNCLDAEAVTLDGDYADCTSCASCYHLENCWDDTDTLTIDNDLTALTEQDAATMVSDGYVFEINGKCYQLTAHNTTCAGAETVEVDRFYFSCGDCGCWLLTECPGGSGGTTYARGAVDGDSNFVWLRDYEGKVVRLSDGLCYSVAASSSCESTSIITVDETYDDCDSCQCFLLEDCDGVESDIVTYTDLNDQIGRVVKIGEVCYEVSVSADCTGAVAVSIGSVHDDCDTCLQTQQYVLTHDCHRGECGGSNTLPDIITHEDLHAAVGLSVKVGGACYSVATTSGETDTHDTLTYQGPYQTCDECLSSPVTTAKQVVVSLAIDGGDLVATTEVLVVEDGIIVGICAGDDVTVDGTDCSD